jgi:hypothetical protein
MNQGAGLSEKAGRETQDRIVVIALVDAVGGAQ